MEERISVLVPCKLAYRDTVGAMVTQVCSQLEKVSEPDGFTYQVISAFNEAFNNHAKHGDVTRNGDKQRDILIVISVTNRQLVIEFQDDGKPFKLDNTEKPDLSQLRESGMGLFIMRAFMSELSYKAGSDNKANVLRLVRNLSSTA